MYGYEELIDLNPEQVLQKVTQQEIFEFVLETPFDFNKRYTSPFRDDKKPDCRFEERPDGIILFIDFGERFLRPERTHRSCFRMVMERFTTDLTGAIGIICRQFGLSTSKEDYTQVAPLAYNRNTSQDSHKKMKYEVKPYQKGDKIWWSQFLIKPEELLEDGVYNTKAYWIEARNGQMRKFTPYSHCYTIDFVDQIKIYQPFSIDYKWLTNCSEDTIGNINNIPPVGDELIIKKSYKDHRVVRNMLTDKYVVYFQNEGCVPSLGILKNLIDRYDLLTFFYDNDEDGIKAAKKLTDICNGIKQGCSRYIHLPLNVPHKDPAKFVSKEGRQDTIQVLHQIGL